MAVKQNKKNKINNPNRSKFHIKKVSSISQFFLLGVYKGGFRITIPISANVMVNLVLLADTYRVEHWAVIEEMSRLIITLFDHLSCSYFLCTILSIFFSNDSVN